MIGFDSSVWIEVWKDPNLAPRLLEIVDQHGGDPERIVIPATVVYETMRWLIRNVDDDVAIAEHAATLDQHDQVSIDAVLARRSALIAAATGLAAADATILAATRSRNVTLLTFDSDFAGIPDVVVLER